VPLVRQAREQVAAGRGFVACGLLGGFLTQLQVYEQTGLITSAQAQPLRAEANAIRVRLGCG
jgi:hypothetical protein